MDKKNEKTFADLFSSSKMEDNVETSSEVTTFDSLASVVFDDEVISDDESNKIDSTLTFNDIEANISSDVFNNADSGENKEDVFDGVSNLFFDEVADEISDDDVEVSGENKSDNSLEKVEIDAGSLFFGEEKLDVTESNDNLGEAVNLIDKEEGSIRETDNVVSQNENVQEEKVEIDAGSLFFGEEKLDVTESNDNLGEAVNLIDKEEASVREIDNAVSQSENVQEEKVEIDAGSLFFGEEKLDEGKNNNLEGTAAVVVGDIGVENKENMSSNVEVKQDESVPVSISPFFEESTLNNEIKENILGNINISLDETNNINSKTDKIDFSNTKNFNVKVVKKKEPFFKFILSVISYAFFIFLMLVLVALLAYVLDIKIRASKGDNTPPTFNAYVVLTGSMLPDIKVKDVVVTKRIPAKKLVVGDIITFASSDSRYSGTIITHRIIKKNQDEDGNITFQTKGDNNNVADSALVVPGNIYGKVILKIPKLGYLQDFLATQGGWIIVILIPCLTVISYDIVKLSKGLKRKKIKVKK